MSHSKKASIRMFSLNDCRELGDLRAGVLMGYLVQQMTVGKQFETCRYIRMPMSKITEEVGLSRCEQETVRKILVEKEWIDVKKMGIPCTQYICITDKYGQWSEQCNTK